MDETSERWAADIEASLNAIPFDYPEIAERAAECGLTGTCQFTITGIGTWLLTFKNGMHTTERYWAACDPPPDATLIMSPETYLRVMNWQDELDAETAYHQGLIEISGDERLARAVLRGAG